MIKIPNEYKKGHCMYNLMNNWIKCKDEYKMTGNYWCLKICRLVGSLKSQYDGKPDKTNLTFTNEQNYMIQRGKRPHNFWSISNRN